MSESSASETTKKKSASAFRTIGEVAAELSLPPHVLRFWESKFTQIKPQKRRGGHRYYRPADIEVIKEIKSLLYDRGYTIKGAQKHLKEQRRSGNDDNPANVNDNFVEGILPEKQDNEDQPKLDFMHNADAQHRLEHVLNELKALRHLLHSSE